LMSYLEAVVDAATEMEGLIKKNFKLSEEKLYKFISNNPIQMTLREELEVVSKEKAQLEEENASLKMSMINRENDSKSVHELHQ